MRYLIDTNILIFALSNQEYYIDKNVLSLLSDYDNTIYVSSSSVFEAGHNDPIDRIIIAQSITEKIPLISSDSKFKYYKNLDFIYNDKRAR